MRVAGSACRFRAELCVQDRGDGVGVGGEDRDVDGVPSARGVAPLRIRDRRWAARLPGVAHTTEPPP